MTELPVHRYVTVLQADGDRLARAATAAGLDAKVPTCPQWRVRDLVHHVGGVHRWAASYVTTGSREPPTPELKAAFFPPVPDADLLAWFRAGHAELVMALRGADPGLACWSFLPAPSPLVFWARRQAHETAVHRVDAETAAGWESQCAADVAVDGIDELVNGFLSRRRGQLVADPPVSLGLITTDTGDAWTISIEADRRVVRSGAGEAGCRISGPAGDLYLLLWNRRRCDELAVDVRGDAGVLDLWRAKATISWS